MDTQPAKVQCQECGMYEREEWALADKHVCNTITDPHMPAEFCKGMTLKIGKRRFVRIK